MTCLRNSTFCVGPNETVRCGVEGCKVSSFISKSGTQVTNYLECAELKKLDAKVKLLHKIEAAIDEYLQEQLADLGHALAIKIVEEMIKEKL